MGVVQPEATFSACFGAAFLMHHPMRYSRLLAEKMRQHNTNAWLVNTGWSGGGFGEGKRISLKNTRAIIQAIHNGTLAQTPTHIENVFGLAIPQAVDFCPSEILTPRDTWDNPLAYDQAAQNLADLFRDNFAQYIVEADEEIIAAGPALPLRKAG